MLLSVSRVSRIRFPCSRSPRRTPAYWVINVTVVIMALAAAYGQSRGSSRNRTGQFVRLALPRPWTDLVAKWLFYGALAAVVTAGTLVVLLVVLPLVSPLVYGGVAVGDAAARHLLWSVPVLAYFAAGAGAGVGALVSTPTVGVGAILFWVYVVETVVGYLPGGLSFQRFMPFLNAMYGTGQDIVLTPPWSPLGALAYGCLAFGVVFACGVWSVTASKGLCTLRVDP